jgi:hypothetical protein
MTVMADGRWQVIQQQSFNFGHIQSLTWWVRIMGGAKTVA